MTDILISVGTTIAFYYLGWDIGALVMSLLAAYIIWSTINYYLYLRQEEQEDD